MGQSWLLTIVNSMKNFFAPLTCRSYLVPRFLSALGRPTDDTYRTHIRPPAQSPRAIPRALFSSAAAQ